MNLFFTEIIEFQLIRKFPTKQTAESACISKICALISKGKKLLRFFVFSVKIEHTDDESSSDCLQSDYG